MATFLFIEVTDRKLNALFSGISEVVNGSRLESAVHLTIRGPYAGSVPEPTVEKCKQVLNSQVLEFSGVDTFSNPREHVVFLKVHNPRLREVWWKPDYPIHKFGFNPHISIYRGPDESLGKAILQFFRHEGLVLFCAEYRIASRVTRQGDLIPPNFPIAKLPFHELFSNRVRPNILDRLKVVVERAKRRPTYA